MKIIPLAVFLLVVNFQLAYAPNTNIIIIPESKPIIEKPIISSNWENEFKRWKNAMGFSEASGNWTICNELGCMGLYQFQQTTLERLGFYGITPELFKEDPFIFPPELQEQALRALIRTNATDLKDIFKEYLGETIQDIEITRSGLLAASHLAGVGGVIKFLKQDKNPKDKNGTSVACYLEKFKDYNI